MLENDSSCVLTLCARTLIPLDLLLYMCAMVFLLLACFVFFHVAVTFFFFKCQQTSTLYKIEVCSDSTKCIDICALAEHTTLWTCNEWLPLPAQSATLRQIILLDGFFFFFSLMLHFKLLLTFYSFILQLLSLLLPSIKYCSRVCVNKCCC